MASYDDLHNYAHNALAKAAERDWEHLAAFGVDEVRPCGWALRPADEDGEDWPEGAWIFELHLHVSGDDCIVQSPITLGAQVPVPVGASWDEAVASLVRS